MHGLLIDCVVKSWFKNFEKILSKSLKRNESKGIEKKKEKKQTKQITQTSPTHLSFPFKPRGPNQPAHLPRRPAYLSLSHTLSH
jgi:hypothetical protein